MHFLQAKESLKSSISKIVEQVTTSLVEISKSVGSTKFQAYNTKYCCNCSSIQLSWC